MLWNKKLISINYYFLLPCGKMLSQQIKEYYKNGNIREEYTMISSIEKEKNRIKVVRTVEGSYKAWYKNAVLAIESNYSSGKLHGTYTLYYENGNKYKIYNFKNGILHGSSITYYDNDENSIRVINNYIEGQRIGKYEEFYENGEPKIYCENLIGSKYNGKSIYYFEFDNSKLVLNYYDNVLHGLAKTYIDDKLESTKIYNYYIEVNPKDISMYKEELMAKVFHPDRLERMAKLYGLDTIDYIDCFD